MSTENCVQGKWKIFSHSNVLFKDGLFKYCLITVALDLGVALFGQRDFSLAEINLKSTSSQSTWHALKSTCSRLEVVLSTLSLFEVNSVMINYMLLLLIHRNCATPSWHTRTSYENRFCYFTKRHSLSDTQWRIQPGGTLKNYFKVSFISGL